MRIIRILTLLVYLFTACTTEAKDSKDMQAADIAKLIKKDKPVEIADKIIWGDICFAEWGHQQLAQAGQIESVVRSNVVFVNCVFLGRLTTNAVREVKGKKIGITTRFDQNVVFVGCDFRAEVDMDNAVMRSNVDFGRSIFRENVSLCGLCSFAPQTTMAAIVAEKQFRMIYATIMGDLSMAGAEFRGQTSMQELRVRGSLWATDIKSHGIDMGMMEVRGKQRFDNSEGIETNN